MTCTKMQIFGFCWVLLGFFASAQGVEPVAKPAVTAPAATKKAAQELSFEDILVQGKYHFADEAVTTVEEDKVLDGLLGMRKDFKDRLQKSAQQ